MSTLGPTLNPVYNNLLKSWSKQGYSCSPECEECQCDLTGKQVYDVGTSWLCKSCSEHEYDFASPEDEEQEYSFKAGRRKLGYSDKD